MVNLSTLETFINDFVFYKDKWIELSAENRQVIANNADALLKRELSHHFAADNDIPIDVLAEQVIYMLDQDDSFRRAEMGMSYFFTNGLYISFDKNDMGRSIARTILHRYPRRRSGQSVITRSDTFRAYGSGRGGY